MTFNWPDIPFSGTEVDAFVAEYKIVAEELYYNYPYDATELGTPFTNDLALKKYLEFGLVYAAFIVKQRAGNSGPGTDFILGNSPLGPTTAMDSPEKRRNIMKNLGCVATFGAMNNCWQENKEKDPTLDPYDELSPENEPWKGPIQDLMDTFSNLGSTGGPPDDPCDGFYAKYENVQTENSGLNQPLWSAILEVADSVLGFFSPNGYVSVQLLRRYLQGTGGTFNENSSWGSAAPYKYLHKVSIKEHINYWKNDSYAVSERNMSETWRNAFGLSATDKVYQVRFERNFLLASAYGTATVVVSADPKLGDFEVKRLVDDYDFIYGWEIIRSNTGIDVPGQPFNDLAITSGANRKSGPNTCDPNTTVCEAIDREGHHYAIRLPVASAMGQGCWDNWTDHPNPNNSGKPFTININFENI